MSWLEKYPVYSRMAHSSRWMIQRKDSSIFQKSHMDLRVKVLEVDESASKISLSIRALQEPPTSYVNHQKSRQSLQERVKQQDADGFNSLKDKLKDWIEQSGL